MCPAIAPAIAHAHLLSIRPLRRGVPAQRPSRPASRPSSPRLSCTDISNTLPVTPPPPPAPAPRAMAQAQTAAEAKADALEVLTTQIVDLLAQLKPTESAGFRRSVAALALDRHTPLSTAAAEALLRVLKMLPADRRLAPRQQMLRAALYDLTRAAHAERLLRDQIARHGRRQLSNALPGAQRGWTSSTVVGAVVGLPSAAEAGLAIGAHREASTATFDDLAVATVHSTTLVGEASARAGVAPGVAVEASIEVSSTQGKAVIAINMRDHVRSLARASVARRLGGNAVLRGLKRLAGRRRDRHAERVSRAVAWQPRVHMLLGTAAPGVGLDLEPSAPVPLLAELSTTGGAAAATASYGVGGLSLSGQVSRTEFITALPVRLTDLDEDGHPASEDPVLRGALEARMGALLDTAPSRGSPTLAAVRALRAAPARCRLGGRLTAVAQLQIEFQHLEALARHALVAPAQARAPMASLAGDWGRPATACEPVMVAMLDTLAWLQAVPEPERADHAAHADWNQLQKAAQSAAAGIHDSAIPHDRAGVHRATHAFREMIQRIATRRSTLELSAQSLPLTASAQVSLARHAREDPDPLRAGTYLEVALTAQLTADVGAILEEVQRRLPEEWGSLPLEEPQRLLAAAATQFSITGTTQCLLRFFQPAFQADPAFPKDACGAHLQAIRIGTGNAQQLAIKVPLPVVPGVSSTLAVKQTRSAHRTRHERLCAGTLTGALLRYRSLCSSDQSAQRTWAQLLASHGADLDRLADALTDPTTVPAKEARYWLQRGTDTNGDSPGVEPGKHTAVLDELCNEHDRDRRRARLHDVFEHLADTVRRVKAASPLVGAPSLPNVPLIAHFQG